MKVLVTYTKKEILLKGEKDARELKFFYKIINTKFNGTPEERLKRKEFKAYVFISCTLEKAWQNCGLTKDEIDKVMFEYTRRIIQQKVKEGKLEKYEKIALYKPEECEFDPSKIPNIVGWQEIISLPEITVLNEDEMSQEIKSLYFDDDEAQITEETPDVIIENEIIELRDNINAIFVNLHREKLFHIDSERLILDLIKGANSSEEFTSRVGSLGSLVSNLNNTLLSKLVMTEKGEQSLSLLEKYLKTQNKDIACISTFRNIMRIRKGYPIHNDNTYKFIEAHEKLGIDYPIKSFNTVLNKLKLKYLMALQNLFLVLKEIPK